MAAVITATNTKSKLCPNLRTFPHPHPHPLSMVVTPSATEQKEQATKMASVSFNRRTPTFASLSAGATLRRIPKPSSRDSHQTRAHFWRIAPHRSPSIRNSESDHINRRLDSRSTTNTQIKIQEQGNLKISPEFWSSIT